MRICWLFVSSLHPLRFKIPENLQFQLLQSSLNPLLDRAVGTVPLLSEMFQRFQLS